MLNELFLFKTINGYEYSLKYNIYNYNIDYMEVGKQVHEFFYTGNVDYLIGLLTDVKYNILKTDEIVKICLDIYYNLKNTGFKKYEKGKISRPDMYLINNNNKIPLEIKTRLINKIDKDIEEKICKHIEEFNTNICFLLFITPDTLYKYKNTKNIFDVLILYIFIDNNLTNLNKLNENFINIYENNMQA